MADDGVVLTGDRLGVDEYLRDFGDNFWHGNSGVNWKLERRQEFVESANESWEASRRDDWAKSLDLLERNRAEVADYERRLGRNGLEVRRVRVVEHPISPYLLWELTSLHVRQQEGGKIRVVGPGPVAAWETGGAVLPELFLLGRAVAYQVLYDDEGAVSGAVKCVAEDEVRYWTSVVAALYDRGEELGSFFGREVAWRLPTAG